MYKSERIIIDTRMYNIDEVFERYKEGKIIFYEKNGMVRTHKSKITQEVLEALSRGIPFPPVYVSELQTGELLVLDKSERLRFLMEYLETEKKFSFADKYFLKDFIYSTIMFHVIDYMNPKYKHMQVGSFIEEWSAAQEQSIRNILYQGKETRILEDLLSDMSHAPRSRLTVQYNLIYFIMVSFVTDGEFAEAKYHNADRFQLLEETLYELPYKNYEYLRDLRGRFESLYYYNENTPRRISSVFSWERTRYLCFMGAWMKMNGQYRLNEMFENKRIRDMIINCDMSYSSISEILIAIERY